MSPSRSRARAWLAIGALLLVAGGWLLLRRPPRDDDERGGTERAQARGVTANGVALRPSLAPAPPAAPADETDSADLVSVLVTVMADDGSKGEALVEAGPTQATRKPRGYAEFGKAFEMLVPATTRSWQAVARGGDAIRYDGPEVTHDPGRGALVLLLRRGPVSLHAHVVDSQGSAVPDVELHLMGLPGLGWAASRMRSDGHGVARWEGLSARYLHDDVTVQSMDAPTGMRVRERGTVTWDLARSHGKAVVILDWIRTHLEVEAAGWSGGWILEQQGADGVWRPVRLSRDERGPTGPTRVWSRERGVHLRPLHFTTTELQAGRYRITLGLAEGELGQAGFTLAHGESLKIATYERLRPRTLSARLVGPGLGRLRALRIVPAERMPSLQPEAWLDLPVETDGSVALPVLEGFEEVWVLPVPAMASEVSVVPRRLVLRSGATLEVESVGTVRASGRVVDAQGRPIAKAAVSVSIRPGPPAAREPNHPAWFVFPLPGSVSTDADGRFTTEPGVPGAWTFRVLPPGREHLDPRGTEILVGPGTGDIELTP